MVRTLLRARLAAPVAPGAAERGAAAHGAQHLHRQRAGAAAAHVVRVAVLVTRVHATVTCDKKQIFFK